MSTTSSQKPGLRAFFVVWIGQVVSLVGTAMSAFALTIWAWQTTGEATALALVGFFSFAPQILFSPTAGALVDRWNRKVVMALSDLASAVVTAAIWLLYVTGHLEIWHLYVGGFISGTFQAFQWPAYSAAITTMVEKEHYARASGMMSLAEGVSQIFAPPLAAALLAFIGIGGVLFIDLVTFVMALVALLLVPIPTPPRTAEGEASRSSLWQESLYGFRYILARPSLLGLQLTFFWSNFVTTFGFVLATPMILARTNNNELALGSVQSAFGVGGVLGAVLLSVWGGPKRRIHGVLMGFILASLLGETVMGLGRSLPVWMAAAFCTAVLLPILNGSNQAIWQSKVAPDVQGRVFAARRMIAQITAPLAMLLAGPLADNIFEPALRSGDTWLGRLFAPMVGTGPGAGMAAILVLSGVLGALAGVVGYLIPAIRDVEHLLPDHETQTIRAEAAHI
ncbi:MFS transporter, DHA3 family, macrolide efflux protein [Ardenticatena maritima]|uniref:MFS transporter, DHA3 family, macrolide efflux protein n=1 Tax=Ardenticatena maritima TaxID=872965 RepID=A0A0M8K6K9_9CHLR|nr:MFS transporter [Ardenticatena maritima]GAP61841.1 MFS transporter, DHA3 family, macrolide efflux protein [Ardenticatena maritima]